MPVARLRHKVCMVGNMQDHHFIAIGIVEALSVLFVILASVVLLFCY